MSSRNPFGDTSRGSTDDRNTVGGGSTGGTSGGSTGGSSGGGGRDRDDDDDDPTSRNPLGDTSRGRDDDRRQTGGGVPDVGAGDRREVSTDLPRTPDNVGGADFREDSVARNVAQTISELGADVGLGATTTALDAAGAGRGPGREVVERVGESVGRVPGDAVGTGVSIAQAYNEVAGTGAREGPVAAVEEARDITADTVDRGLAATDQLVDVDRERRREGEGAAVQVEEGRRQDAAVTATVSALTLAGGSVGQTATGLSLRGAASRAGGGATPPSGSSPTSGSSNRGLAEFLDDERAQTGGFGSRSVDETAEVTADDLDPGGLDFDPAARRPPERLSPTQQRGGVVRDDDIGAADPIQRRRDQRARGDRSDDARSEDLAFERSLADGETATASATPPTGLGAGVGLGTIADTTDPSGIASGGGVSAGAVGDDRIGVADAGGLGADSVADVNDPTGITPDGGLTGGASSTGTVEEQLELVRATTGLRSGVDTDTQTRTDTETRLDARTGVETGTETEGRVATDTETGFESEIGVEGGTRIETGIDFETTRIPDIPTFGGEQDDEAPAFLVDEDSRRFDSGIASPEDFGLGSGDPFRL